MIERVLIPLDGSEMAESLVPRLRSLIEQSEARLTLLSAVDSRQQVALTGPTLVDELATEAGHYLAGVARKLRERGVTVEVRVEVGEAAETIIDVAKAENSSLICLSTHGRSGFDRMMYGSVTEKVVRGSEGPVMVVPSFDRTEPDGGVDRRTWSFGSVVVPLDGSRQAMQILPHVAEVAGLFGSTVSLLLVLEEGADAELTKQAQKHLEGAKHLFLKAGVNPKTVIRTGDPALEILDYTPRYDHDAIMMTTHGRSGLTRWMLGSVAEKIVRRATVPVLVVRTGPDDDSVA